MKHIVLFGAGKSSTFLINYLVTLLQKQGWRLTVLDANAHLAREKVQGAPNTFASSIDVTDSTERGKWVAEADLVISLLPPALHFLLAGDCLHFGKNLLTASYVDDKMRSLDVQVKEKKLLFLCETGLDPGIDHMSAMKLLHELADRGANITAFHSHCGGLVAPESDDNPWRYKVSWNPRNIVLAGKSGAIFKRKHQRVQLDYLQLFDPGRIISVPGLGKLSWYPNRDSIAYIKTYGLDNVATFIRTTLRYPEFCFGWKNMIELKLTDETPSYDTDGMTLMQFFQQHLQKHGFGEWIERQLTTRFKQTKLLLEKLEQLLNAEGELDAHTLQEIQDFMMVDHRGELLDVNLDAVKSRAAATVAGQMHEANLSMKQLFFLGVDDDQTQINKGFCSAADVLQFAMETKLALKPSDKDMVVMQHEIDYELLGATHRVTSSLIVKGENSTHTAMAKTVGLPLGIAAKLILSGSISLAGVQIPVHPEIYVPILEELEELGIHFNERESE